MLGLVAFGFQVRVRSVLAKFSTTWYDRIPVASDLQKCTLISTTLYSDLCIIVPQLHFQLDCKFSLLPCHPRTSLRPLANSPANSGPTI